MVNNSKQTSYSDKAKSSKTTKPRAKQAVDKADKPAKLKARSSSNASSITKAPQQQSLNVTPETLLPCQKVGELEQISQKIYMFQPSLPVAAQRKEKSRKSRNQNNLATTTTILTAAISVKRQIIHHQRRQNTPTTMTPLSKPAILKFTIAKIQQSWKKRKEFNVGLSLNQSSKVTYVAWRLEI